MEYPSLAQKRTVKSAVKLIYNCAACVHWIEHDKDFKKRLMLEHHDFRIGYCNGPPEDNFDVRDMKADQMAVICGHDGGVKTGENFGCIHYKNERG